MNFKAKNLSYIATALCLCTVVLGKQAYAVGTALLHTAITQLENAVDNHVLVVAHRGCWRSAPENSLAAIETCIDIGVDMVEIDVRRAKDGGLVVIHDETLERTTNGEGSVSSRTLPELSRLKLRQGAGGADAVLTEQRLPTLEQVLRAVKGRILINLDAKEAVRNQAFALAQHLGVEKQVLFKSVAAAEDPELRSARYLDNSYYMPIIHGDKLPRGINLVEQLQQYDTLNPVAIEVVFQEPAFAEAVAEFTRARNIRLWVNTMAPRYAAGYDDDKSLGDPEGNWGVLIAMGAGIIQTDRPGRLLDYLKQKDLR